MIAEEALKTVAVVDLGLACGARLPLRQGRLEAARSPILDNNLASGLIDKPTYRRQRGVLLTARALELETVDRDLSRDVVMEAVKLAPTLVPAAVLAAKFQSEAHQIRRAMRLVEAAWLAQPHPDLADAYAHVKLGDSARQRLVRIETLAAKMPGHLESALAIARAAIDATEFGQSARGAGALSRCADAARGDVDGRDRAHRTWRHRQGAGLDIARGARASRCGLDRGRLCLRPVAAGIAGIRTARCLSVADAALGVAVRQRRVELSPFEQAMLAATPGGRLSASELPDTPPALVAQDNAPTLPPVADPTPSPPPPAAHGSGPSAAAVSRPHRYSRHERKARPSIPPVIPIIRPPDDPGVDDGTEPDEFAELPAPGQTGGGAAFSPASAADSKTSRPNKGMRSEDRPLPRYEVAGASVFLAKRGAARYQVRAFSGEPIGFGTNIPMPLKTLRSGPPQ